MSWQSVPKKAPTLDGIGAGEEWAAGFAERYRNDAELRRRCDSGETTQVVAEHGMSVPPGVEARIAEDTDEVTHLVFPMDPNTELEDEVLAEVSGGSGIEATCAASASTVSSIPSTVFSAGTASTFCPGVQLTG